MATKTKPTKVTPATPMVEFEMTAVIPVAQYANVQPVVKGYGATYEEARDDALKKSRDIWAMVGEGGKSLEVRGLGEAPTVQGIERETLKCWATGTEVFYDDPSHTYVDAEGNSYLSGSNFAKQFAHEFNEAAILPKYAEKHGLKPEDIKEYWQAKSNCSTTWGTAIHQAMETYGEHLEIAEKLGKETGVHPLLLPIVEEFFKTYPGKRAFERFVANKDKMRCGRIDSLLLNDDGTITIEDFKTNADLHKMGSPKTLKAPYSHLPNTPFGEYVLQINFYRSILEDAGKKVKDMYLRWLNADGEWESLEIPRTDIEEKQSKIDLSVIV